MESERKIDVALSGEGEAITTVEFYDVTNLNVIAPSGWTLDGSVWEPPTGSSPQAALFTLTQADQGKPEVGFNVIVTNACGKADVDPVMHFDRAVPERFGLSGNYPNPFAEQTAFAVELPEAAPVQVTVYDVTGREVATLVERDLQAGVHTVRWDGRSEQGQRLASGVYLVRLQAGTRTATQRITLVR
jgi:hypothetical protein